MNDQKSYSSFYKVLRNIHYKEIAGSSISFPVGGAASSTYGWNDKEQNRFIKWMSLARLFSLGQRILPLGGFLQWLRDVPWDSRASNQIALSKQHDNIMTEVSQFKFTRSTTNSCLNNLIIFDILTFKQTNIIFSTDFNVNFVRFSRAVG